MTFQAMFNKSQALITIFRAFLFPLCSHSPFFRLCFPGFPSHSIYAKDSEPAQNGSKLRKSLFALPRNGIFSEESPLKIPCLKSRSHFLSPYLSKLRLETGFFSRNRLFQIDNGRNKPHKFSNKPSDYIKQYQHQDYQIWTIPENAAHTFV